MAEKHRNAPPKGYEIEGYRIETVLGSGGFGITYRAREIEIDRKVAIKEYLPTGLATRDTGHQSVEVLSESDRQGYEFGLERFRQEAKTLVKFRHLNIVSVLRYFAGNGTAYLVMDYEAGNSLYAILARHETLSEDEVHEILFPLLDGLEKVHEAKFLHRDIKPGNIYIRKDGSPVLLDFGAARLALGEESRSLTSIVTKGYAPFEQYTSHGDQGPWTDIYALGAVLYRAVTGVRPPEAPDRMIEDRFIPTAEAVRGHYSNTLLRAIDSALLTDPKSRPQTVAAWRAMLDAPKPLGRAARKAVVASSAPSAGQGIRPRKGQAWRAGLISLVLVLAIAGGGVWGWSKYQAVRDRSAQLAAELSAKTKAQAAEKARLDAVRIQAELKRRRDAEAKRQAEIDRRTVQVRRQAEEARKRQVAEVKRRAEIKRQADVDRQAKEARKRRVAAVEARRRAAEQRRRQAGGRSDSTGQKRAPPRKSVAVARGGRNFPGVYPASAAAWANKWPTGRVALWRDKFGDSGGLTPIRNQERSRGEVCRQIRWWTVLSGRRVTGENFYCRKSNGSISLRPRY